MVDHNPMGDIMDATSIIYTVVFPSHGETTVSVPTGVLAAKDSAALTVAPKIAIILLAFGALLW